MAGLSFSLPFAGGGGVGMGMGLPPLSLSSSASNSWDQHGADFGFGGDWTVNQGGSGTALQSGASGGGAINWLLIAAAVGAVWLMQRG